MGKLNAFYDYLQEQVAAHSIYVWGGQGEKGSQITEAWIRRMETSTANSNRAIAYWKKQIAAGYGGKLRAFDCSGLAVYFLLGAGLLKSDTTAEGLRSMCDKINRGALRRGDWVFRVSNGRAYHIGYVVDDQLNVVEAMGRDDGVVKRGLTANGGSYWNAYGRPNRFFGKELEPPKPPAFLNYVTAHEVDAFCETRTISAARTLVLESYTGSGGGFARVKNPETGNVMAIAFDCIARSGAQTYITIKPAVVYRDVRPLKAGHKLRLESYTDGEYALVTDMKDGKRLVLPFGDLKRV